MNDASTTTPADHQAVATLAIPQQMDLAWATSFADEAGALIGRPGLRAVTLVGSGRFFCLGGDLAWMRDQPDREHALSQLAGALHDGVRALASLPVPVIAKVHGPAAGAGMSLVRGADIALAAKSASFTMAYAGVGLSPDGGASWLLPRTVGHRRAIEVMLSNRTIKAPEAQTLGITTTTVDDDDLDATFQSTVARLADGPTAAYAAAKTLVNASTQATFSDQLDAEAASIARLAGSPTGHEGVDAFLERRAPAFPYRALEP